VDEEKRRLEMNRAFRQARERLGLNGATPIIELVAVRLPATANSTPTD
jgi:hypothetical protein